MTTRERLTGKDVESSDRGYIRIYLEVNHEKTQDSQFPGRDLKLGAKEYEAELPRKWPLRSVHSCNRLAAPDATVSILYFNSSIPLSVILIICLFVCLLVCSYNGAFSGPILYRVERTGDK
jgi:hypothetical protein